jgi:hypothetical protein
MSGLANAIHGLFFGEDGIPALEQNVAPEDEQNVAPEDEQNVAPEVEQNVAPEDEQNVAPEDEQNVAPEEEPENSPQRPQPPPAIHISSDASAAALEIAEEPGQPEDIESKQASPVSGEVSSEEGQVAVKLIPYQDAFSSAESLQSPAALHMDANSVSAPVPESEETVAIPANLAAALNIKEGDSVVFNRHPGHVMPVKVSSPEFGLNVAPVEPYTADFDGDSGDIAAVELGDEMNMHVPDAERSGKASSSTAMGLETTRKTSSILAKKEEASSSSATVEPAEPVGVETPKVLAPKPQRTRVKTVAEMEAWLKPEYKPSALEAWIKAPENEKVDLPFSSSSVQVSSPVGSSVSALASMSSEQVKQMMAAAILEHKGLKGDKPIQAPSSSSSSSGSEPVPDKSAAGEDIRDITRVLVEVVDLKYARKIVAMCKTRRMLHEYMRTYFIDMTELVPIALRHNDLMKMINKSYSYISNTNTSLPQKLIMLMRDQPVLIPRFMLLQHNASPSGQSYDLIKTNITHSSQREADLHTLMTELEFCTLAEQIMGMGVPDVKTAYGLIIECKYDVTAVVNRVIDIYNPSAVAAVEI